MWGKSHLLNYKALKISRFSGLLVLEAGVFKFRLRPQISRLPEVSFWSVPELPPLTFI